MISQSNRSGPRTGGVNPQKKKLPPEAKRALAEAAERRKAADLEKSPDLPVEINGRKGPDPVRYGDWEKKGIAVDF